MCPQSPEQVFKDCNWHIPIKISHNGCSQRNRLPRNISALCPAADFGCVTTRSNTRRNPECRQLIYQRDSRLVHPMQYHRSCMMMRWYNESWLICMVCVTEYVPSKWWDTAICVSYEQVARSWCGHLRGLNLFCLASKLLAVIALQWLLCLCEQECRE